jgi:hypothetical protein
MPDNIAQLKFIKAYSNKLQKAITQVTTIFNKIKPKDRSGRLSAFNSLKKLLVDIKDYAYANTSVNPPVDIGTAIKHDEKSLVRVRNAKQNLKMLFNTVVVEKQKEVRQGYTSTLDILNRFEDYLEKK